MLVRGHPTTWSPGGAEELETNPSVPQQEEQTDARDGKAIEDYDPNIAYEPEGSDSDIKAVKKEKENSDIDYEKI